MGGSFVLRPDVMRAIKVIRMLLVILMTVAESPEFSRTLESFRERAHVAVIDFDASLSGMGLVWYAVDASDTCPIVASSPSIVCLAFRDMRQITFNPASFEIYQR